MDVEIKCAACGHAGLKVEGGVVLHFVAHLLAVEQEENLAWIKMHPAYQDFAMAHATKQHQPRRLTVFCPHCGARNEATGYDPKTIKRIILLGN